MKPDIGQSVRLRRGGKGDIDLHRFVYLIIGEYPRGPLIFLQAG